MANPTQFRHYLIAQDAEGHNIEVVRSGDQVGVLAFDSHRLTFVHCHVLLESLKNRRNFDERGQKLGESGHPALARLLESGEDEGSAFYITENVDGETLRSYLSRFEDLPVWLAMRLTLLSIQSVRALIAVGDYLPNQPFESLRLLQTGSNALLVKLADFRMVDEASGKSGKTRLAKDAFSKQSQFLQAFFAERQETAGVMDVPMLSATDFAELLQNLLMSCAPGHEAQIDAFIATLQGTMPTPPPGELAATLKPKPLVAPMLATYQEVARSLVQGVRIQSQKLDAGQPYSLRGVLMKTGQNILVEQVPPRRMTGNIPFETLQQVRNLPKAGKFPNLVPVLFTEKSEELECMAETAVEGVSLNVVLEARGTLDVQEAYLVLAGVDAALAQLEKAGLTTPRLRLEDVFLFTGFTKQAPLETGLLQQKLNEWPGFSIVLRTHPCLHAMTGRGTDPAMLLPLEMKHKPEAEPIWNGAWMAALACLMAGMPSGVAAKHETGVSETDTVYRLLDDELSKARKGSPSSRASFLARFARVMQQFDLAQFSRSGGFWTELSGSATAQGHAAEVARAAVVLPAPKKTVAAAALTTSHAAFAPVAPVQDTEETEEPSIGFAEALIRQPEIGDQGRGRVKSGRPLMMDTSESSWTGLHEKRSFFSSLLLFFFSSLFAGMALAHLSGRAFWQGQGIEIPKAEAVIEEPKMPEIDLPVAPPKTPKLIPPKEPTLLDIPTTAAKDDPTLTRSLQQLRKSGEKLPSSLQARTKSAAQAGNTEAMLALGRAMLRGENMPVDESAAFDWFEKAHSSGEPAATVPLAQCYLQGWGTTPNFAQAINLLTAASNKGDMEAKDLLAVCVARGIGLEKDDAKAFALSLEAYKAGVTSACGNLGAMYLRGQGVAPDAARALQLFAEGASRGHSDSMLSYAQCLESGTGTPTNLVEARQWYQQAARLGNAEAANWCRLKNVAY
jgi:hypothetical protein